VCVCAKRDEENKNGGSLAELRRGRGSGERARGEGEGEGGGGRIVGPPRSFECALTGPQAQLLTYFVTFLHPRPRGQYERVCHFENIWDY
jgi:hypothetical protein